MYLLGRTVRARNGIRSVSHPAVTEINENKELEEYLAGEARKVSQRFQAWNSAKILKHDKYHNIRTGLRLAAPTFGNPIIFSQNQEALKALSKKITLQGTPSYYFDSHLEIETKEPNFSDDIASIFSPTKLEIDVKNMTSVKEKFITDRRQHIESLEKVCGFPIESYPISSLLETVLVDSDNFINSLDDYHRAIARFSYSYRGQLKLQIQKNWLAWITKTVRLFLDANLRSSFVSNSKTEHDFDSMVIFNLLDEDTFFPFSGFFTPIQQRRLFSTAGYIRESKGSPIFASDGQSLMVPTFHLNVPTDFVQDHRHGPNLKIIYDEELYSESTQKSAQPMTSRVRPYTNGEVFVYYEKPEYAERAVEIFNEEKWSKFLPFMKSDRLQNQNFRVSQLNISRAIENMEIRARVPMLEDDRVNCKALWDFFNVQPPPDRAVLKAIFQESIPILEEHVKKSQYSDPYMFLDKITDDLASGEELHKAIVFVAKLIQIIHECFDLSVHTQSQTNIAFLTIYETKDFRELLLKHAVVQVLEGKEQFIRRKSLESFINKTD